MAYKQPAIICFQKEIKSSRSSSVELNELREKMRDILPLCDSAFDAYEFINARLLMGLITDPIALQATGLMMRMLSVACDEEINYQPQKRAPKRRCNREALIAREEESRRNIPKVGCYRTSRSKSAALEAPPFNPDGRGGVTVVEPNVFVEALGQASTFLIGSN